MPLAWNSADYDTMTDPLAIFVQLMRTHPQLYGSQA